MVELFHRRITMLSQKNCTIDVQPRFNFREDKNIISTLCFGKILFHVLRGQNSGKNLYCPFFFFLLYLYSCGSDLKVKCYSPRKLHSRRTDLISRILCMWWKLVLPVWKLSFCYWLISKPCQPFPLSNSVMRSQRRPAVMRPNRRPAVCQDGLEKARGLHLFFSLSVILWSPEEGWSSDAGSG